MRGGDMPRVRDPNREKSYKLFKEHNGNIQNREIAKQLGISEKTVSGWKCKDKWNEKLNGVLQTNKRSTPKKKRSRGGQQGNQNAKGHGAPEGNKNAERHGFYTKYLPEDTLDIMKDTEKLSILDILWENICFQRAIIIRSQRIMYVKDHEDHTQTKVKEAMGNVISKEWEMQYAWDKQANAMKAQSTAIKTLIKLIKDYQEELHKNWDYATDEQKLRIQLLEKQLNDSSSNESDAVQSWMEAVKKARESDG